MTDTGKFVGGIVTGLFAVAIVAVVLSTKANTQNVISTSFSGLANVLTAAIKPITG